MSIDYIKQVAVTGDVSTIVNDEQLLNEWVIEVAKEIWEQKPEFAVVHVQGLRSSNQPDRAADRILNGVIRDPAVQKQFKASRSFFDTRETGLGSIYLFRESGLVDFYDKYSNTGYKAMRDGHQFEIGAREFDGFTGFAFADGVEQQHRGYNSNSSNGTSSTDGPTGFLIARFRIHGKELTFINLSLYSVPFEDINELIERPEVTKAARVRQEQIDTILEQLESEGLKDDAILVAGAFNAQLHETQMLTDLAHTQQATIHTKTADDGRVAEIEERDRHGRAILTVKSNRFDLHTIHDWFFRLGRGQMVKKYNGELAQVAFGGKLYEEPVFFQPSRHYGIKEGEEKEEFLRHLCPAWADRVLYNSRMSDLFRHDSFCASGLYYGLVGDKCFIGQHKPVALHGTICLK